ncbi:MAG: hypothetical protein VKI82_10345 [Leptolyngbya sp.]|nr:hypothetical protein [Leptolyngbya sp.]
MTQAADDRNDSQQVIAEIRELKQEVEQFNQKFDNYQKSAQWRVRRPDPYMA